VGARVPDLCAPIGAEKGRNPGCALPYVVGTFRGRNGHAVGNQRQRRQKAAFLVAPEGLIERS
jgi:hypothetical protein